MTPPLGSALSLGGLDAASSQTSAASPVQRKAAAMPAWTAEESAAPVQARGEQGDRNDAANVHAAAARGTATPASTLPHAEQIQQSFGRHDISGIQAHTGSEAAASARDMGAQAYATGNRVVLGDNASLHTVAHEAAHVVQQRAGVSLKGGVGAVGDPYERHADAVADVVVAGGSAEGLLTQMAGPPSGAAPSGAVQRAVVQMDGDEAAQPPQGAEQAAQATQPTQPTGFARVQAACAAKDLKAILAVQTELVAKLQTDPTEKDARDGVSFARTWTMDRVAEIRDTYAPKLKSAQLGADIHADTTDGVEALEKEMDAACTPYLDLLMKGDPQYRYLHFNAAVQEKVLAAVQLHSLRRGLSQIGHAKDAEKESRAEGGVGEKDDWCGAFAYAQGHFGGGMDARWKGFMQGEGGIRGALSPTGTKGFWIWVFDHWEALGDYHATRGSQRMYQEITKGPPAMGIRPGDLVLIDRVFGTNPDHITTAVSFDGRYLTTMGGNQGPGELGVSRSGSAIDLMDNPAPNDVTDYQKTHVENGKLIKVALTDVKKNWRVHGIGRWSIVDYETHVYSESAAMPTKPPSSAQVSRASGKTGK